MTVEIREYETLNIYGTGVLLSTTGHVVTCGHVVEACGVDRKSLRSGLVRFRIPATRTDVESWFEAELVWVPPDAEDDLVVLCAIAGSDLIPPERVAVCGPADDSDLHDFRSYGFRGRGEYQGLYSRGSIECHVASSAVLLCEPLQLRSSDLDDGMSGAAVFDLERNLVVGFVRQVSDPAAGSMKDRDLAFAVDAEVLTHSPLVTVLRRTSLAPGLSSGPASMASESSGAVRVTDRHFLLHAPEPLTAFVGREAELSELDRIWQSPHIRVVTVTGLPGQGKTALVREWIERLITPEAVQPPASVFWWTFAPQRQEVDELFSSMITHLSAGEIHPEGSASTSGRADEAAANFLVGRNILVLDGINYLQRVSGDLHGTLTSNGIWSFLRAVLSTLGSSALCVSTGELPVPELEPFLSHQHRPLAALTDQDSIALLRATGVAGADRELLDVAGDWGNHALALAAVASLLRRDYEGRAQRTSQLLVGQSLPMSARLRMLGNLIEADRAPFQVALLQLLALVRTSIEPAVAIQLAASFVVGEAVERERDLSELLSRNILRQDAEAKISLHPTMRNLYLTNNRLMPREKLVELHRELAQYHYRKLPPSSSSR